MTRSKSILAYQDAKELWDVIYQQSRNRPNNDIIVNEPGKQWTEWERQEKILRLCRYRALLRKTNAEMYPKGHPSHGTSIFDEFVVGKALDSGGSPVIRVYKRSVQGLKVTAGDSEIVLDMTRE